MLACEDINFLRKIRSAITNKMAVQQQLGDYNHNKCALPHQRKTLSQINPTLGAFS